MRFFALTVPGLGSLLRKELTGQVEAVGEVEHDGRSDVVPLAAAPTLPIETRLAEDLFVEIGTGHAGAPLSRLAGHLWSSSRYDGALPAIAARLGGLGPRPGFHVVARLRAERGFLRTELRDELARAILKLAELSTGMRGPVLDPCCGAGTIVREALDTGLGGVGADVAADAIRAARSNLPPGAPLVIADARALPF